LSSSITEYPRVQNPRLAALDGLARDQVDDLDLDVG
jgi:hypothetical protein